MEPLRFRDWDAAAVAMERHGPQGETLAELHGRLTDAAAVPGTILGITPGTETETADAITTVIARSDSKSPGGLLGMQAVGGFCLLLLKGYILLLFFNSSNSASAPGSSRPD